MIMTTRNMTMRTMKGRRLVLTHRLTCLATRMNRSIGQNFKTTSGSRVTRTPILRALPDRSANQFVHLLRLLPACDLPVKVPEGVLGRKTNAEAGKTSQNLTSRRASTSLDSTAKRKQLTQLAGQNRPSDVDRQVGRVEGLDRVWATRQAAQTILAAQGVVLNLNVLDENR
jgi:hypothetical protein